MNRYVVLAEILAVLFLVLALFLGNEPVAKRYRQRAMPVAAFGIALGACIILLKYRFAAESFFNDTLSWLDPLVPIDLSPLRDFFVFCFNLALLLLLLSVKWTGRGLGMLGRGIRWLFRSLARRPQDDGPPPARFRLLPAYDVDLDRGVFLHPSWVFAGRYFRFMAALSLLAVIIYTALPAYRADLLPDCGCLDLFVVPMFIFFEIGWYLGGAGPEIGQARFHGATAGSRTRGSFSNLWEYYLTICSGRNIANDPRIAYQVRHDTPVPDDVSAAPGRGESPILQDLSIIERSMARCGGRTLDLMQKQALRAGLADKDLLLIEATWQKVIPVVFSLLQRDLLNGGHVLVLVPVAMDDDTRRQITKWLQGNLSGQYFTSMNVEPGKAMGRGQRLVCASLPEIMARSINFSWLDSLTRVLVLEVASVFYSNRSQAREFCDLLGDHCATPPGYIMLCSNDRATSESSLRDYFGVEPEEFVFCHGKNRQHGYHVWTEEGEPPFQEQLVEHFNASPLGNAIPLLVPILREKIAPVHAMGLGETFWGEELEELRKAFDTLRQDDFVHWELPALHSPEERGVVIARDRESNLVGAMRQGLDFNQEETLLLCVSPPYLLRDYLASNLRFFLDSDSLNALQLSPRPLGTRATTAVYLFNRMKNAPVAGQALAGFLDGIGYECRRYGVTACLADLFQECFGIDIIRDALLLRKMTYRFEPDAGRFVQKYRLGLATTAGRFVDHSPYAYFQITDSSGNVLGLVHSDEVDQRYLPFQIHAFAGEPYRITKIDRQENKLHLLHTTSPEPAGRTYRHIRVHARGEARIHCLDGGQPRFVNQVGIGRQILEQDVTVTTSGYQTFCNGWQLCNYTPLDQEKCPARHYGYGRFFVLRLFPPRGMFEGPLLPDLEKTLALLLQELAPTIFPESHHWLLVSAPSVAERDGQPGMNGAFDDPLQLLPVFSCLGLSGPADSSCLTIVFFEDAFFDQGLLGCLVEHWQHLFILLEDYLCWLLDGQDGLRSDYLLFGKDVKPEWLRLRPLLQLLERLLAGARVRLRYQRQPRTGIVEQSTSFRICDFCGREISSADFEQLEDGRERCAACRSSAVNTLHELKKIYRESRKELQQQYKIRLRASIDVTFTDAAAIAAEYGIEFTPTPGFDPRPVGFAKCRGNGHEIFIENGQPYHMVLATMVHELTHVWQFHSLDMKRLERDHGKVWIEGHAQWTEITCLERRGIGPRFCEYEKQRDDLYGVGYREIDALLESMGSRNPFAVLRDKYPGGDHVDR